MERLLKEGGNYMVNDCYEYLIELITKISGLDVFDTRILENIKSDISNTFLYVTSVSHVYVKLRLLLFKDYEEQHNIIMQLIVYSFGKKYIYM